MRGEGEKASGERKPRTEAEVVFPTIYAAPSWQTFTLPQAVQRRSTRGRWWVVSGEW